jgi:CheY-like chemotaxis protein
MEPDVDGGPQKRALVVDDYEDIQFLLATMLRQAGYDVETAFSAHEALEKFQGGGFCLVLSDIGMPVMNGYELSRKLRAMPECKAVVMIAITGMAIHGDRDRALQAGFDDLVMKPIGPLSLIATIERLTKKRK